jgi:hypothetical protein
MTTKAFRPLSPVKQRLVSRASAKHKYVARNP